ncbi:hypothetical protein J0689_25715, partial [Vibrio parahaemolyticus]|uniref:hypothetical protein n=1 Tax=Vibrio parahaemolyticus TaxID=670 RepID=UPI001A8E5694
MEVTTLLKPFIEMGLGVASFVALLLFVFRDVKDLKGELKGQTQVLHEIKNELRAARGVAAHPTPAETPVREERKKRGVVGLVRA